MGVVYLATDAEDRPVAVKVLRPAVAGDPDARRRLAREVETMRRVRSPYVAEVIDADVTCDPPYIVTRYVQGRTLEQVVTAGGPRRGQELAAVARGLAAALTAVHAAGVVHRDVKPGNIMLAGGEPVVIDFGIAHLPDSTRITQTGMFMGTPGYLAPEVIEGKQSGQASDVHSWGATVAFAATGRPPFGTGSFETIFYRIVHGQPDLDGCPPPILPLVAAALARDPARRPAAAELAERAAALVPVTLVPGPARSPPGFPARQIRRSRQRARWLTGRSRPVTAGLPSRRPVPRRLLSRRLLSRRLLSRRPPCRGPPRPPGRTRRSRSRLAARRVPTSVTCSPRCATLRPRPARAGHPRFATAGQRRTAGPPARRARRGDSRRGAACACCSSSPR